MTADPRRRLPQVNRLADELAAEARDVPRPVVVDAVRAVVEATRRRARRGGVVPDEAEVKAMVRAEVDRRRRSLLRPVINATGVVLHTNLGRAPLSERAIEAMARAARGYSNLEFDLTTGRRGDRFSHVEPLLALATGAQAALVVNNNASAVLLVCAALASGREVVISRGELIEIGGSFRIPDVLSASGAVLREVGTTNRTHLRDYERAVGPDTAMLLSVHPSNYRIVGFTATPALADLAGLAKRRGIPLVFDAGSGLVAHPLGDEPVVPDALASGAALVCFSGDKLYGGPQAGIVCGRAALIDRLRRHPLLRALRPDKTTLAALEATTLAYLDGTVEELPVWDMLDAPAGTLHRRATRLARALGEAGYTADVIQGESVTGGGSLPEHAIASAVVRVRHETLGPTKLAAALREGDPPVIARIESRAVVVDVRTVHRREDRALLDAFRRCVRPPDEPTPTGRPRRR